MNKCRCMLSEGFVIAIIVSLTLIIKAGAIDYVGCFVDCPGNRLLPDIVGPPKDPHFNHLLNSAEYCQLACQGRYNNNFKPTYFGTEYKWQCYCGNDYTRHGAVDNAECNITCAGNSSQMCGGDNRISVYYVCRIGSFGRDCEKICHCTNGAPCTRNGSCPGRRCATGWHGPTCSEGCSRGSYGPICNETCHCADGNDCNRNGSCVGGLCTPGWQGLTCSEDVNECAENLNNCDQICENNNGSFSCICSEGFETQNEGVTCTDINECVIYNGGCSHQCNNIMGSYHCDCPYHMKRSTNGHSCIDLPVNTLSETKEWTNILVIWIAVAAGVIVAINRAKFAIDCCFNSCYSHLWPCRKVAQSTSASDNRVESLGDISTDFGYVDGSSVSSVISDELQENSVRGNASNYLTILPGDYSTGPVESLAHPYLERQGSVNSYEGLNRNEERIYINQPGVNVQPYTSLGNQ